MKAIEVYCSTSSTTSRNNAAMVVNNSPQLIVAEDEKIFVEEMVGDTMVLQEKYLFSLSFHLLRLPMLCSFSEAWSIPSTHSKIRSA